MIIIIICNGVIGFFIGLTAVLVTDTIKVEELIDPHKMVFNSLESFHTNIDGYYLKTDEIVSCSAGWIKIVKLSQGVLLCGWHVNGAS